MLRAAIVEKSKEHREYIRASLTGINMDIQVSEYADEYDYLDDLNEDASSFDILLLNTTIHREGDGLELAAKVRARSRKVMICFITDSQRYYAEAFSVFATGYLLYPFDVSELHNCITFFWQKPTMERRASLMLKDNIINLRLDITHLYYPAKNSFQKSRLKRREIFTELLLYTLTT